MVNIGSGIKTEVDEIALISGRGKPSPYKRQTQLLKQKLNFEMNNRHIAGCAANN
jgi:hypothetical protein